MTISNPPKGDADKKIGAEFAPLSVAAQTVPNMTVKVRAGWFYDTNGNVVEYAGGNSPVIAAPLSNAKWVVVGVNNSGSIVLFDGTPAVSPTLPTVVGAMPLVFVFVSSTTTAVTADRVFDARPLFRTFDLTTALANYTTFTDVQGLLLGKADVDGTPNTDFALNKGNSGATDSQFSVQRGVAPTVGIRWHEGTAKWQFTNDGTIYNDIGASSGVFMDLVSGPVAGHVLTTDGLGQAQDGGIALAALETVAAATASLALKADKVVPSAAHNLAQLTVSGNLEDSGVLVSSLATTTALALKANDSAVVHNTGVESIAGAKTFTANVTLTPIGGPAGNPTLSAGFFGSDMGFEVARTAFPANPAILIWDEASVTWQVGIVGGPLDSILTASVVTGKVDRTDTVALSGDVTASATALTGPSTTLSTTLANTAVTPGSYGSASAVGTFTVDSKGRLTAAAPATIAITASQVTDFSSAADARIAAAVGVSVEAFDATILKSADIGVSVEAFDATILKSADIGVTVQAWDADLDGVAALAGTGIVVHTGAGTFTERTLTSTGSTITVTNGDGVAGNPNVDLPNVGTPGTYDRVTTDAQGRVSAGVTQLLAGSQAFTFGAIAASDVGDSTNTATVTGAVVGDIVSLGLPAVVPAGFTYVGYVSAPDTVTVRAHGSASSGTGGDAADATIQIVVTKFANV